MSDPRRIESGSQAELVELLRRALMREHHRDWTMEVISEAAHICARVVATSYPTKPLTGDTPELAKKRYRSGGFGKIGSPSAKASLDKYLQLFTPTKELL
jgi:hypothetical protein